MIASQAKNASTSMPICMQEYTDTQTGKNKMPPVANGISGGGTKTVNEVIQTHSRVIIKYYECSIISKANFFTTSNSAVVM